jgi:TPR repeat protein
MHPSLASPARWPWFSTALPRALLAILISAFSSTMAFSGFDEGVADYRAGNYKDAFWEWNEAAQQGDADAQYNLGCLYDRGEGTPQDRASAQRWLQRAADQGDIDAATWLLFVNPQTDEDRKKFFSMRFNPNSKFHITFAAQQRDGHVMRWSCKTDEKDGAQIEFAMGLMFEKGGMGPPQDEKQAAEWYRRASDRDFADAQTQLAYMYTDGRGVEQDLTEAGRLFFKAAEHGNATAQVNLGTFYSNGSFGFAKTRCSATCSSATLPMQVTNSPRIICQNSLHSFQWNNFSKGRHLLRDGSQTPLGPRRSPRG